MEERKRNYTIAAGLIVLAAVLRFYGIGWGLPQVYEEATPLKTAWRMWGPPFDANPHFFRYPSLTIYLQLIGQGLLFAGMKVVGTVESFLDYRVQYVLDKTPFYILGRSITAGFAVATVYMTWLLGRRILGPVMGIVAALFLAINTAHITKSQVVEVDAVLAFFTVLALDRLIRLLEEPSRRNYLIAGAMVGLAASAKYPGAILALSLVAAHLLALRTAPGNPGHRKPPWLYPVLGLVSALVAFAVTSPYVLLDWGTFTQHLSFERQHMQLGHFGSDTTAAWLFYLRSLANDLLGIPLALLSLAGLVYLTGIRRRRWAVVLAAFAVPYLAALMSWSMHADRYLLPVLPVALLFAAAALAELRRIRLPVPKAARPAVGAVVIVLLAAPLLTAFPGVLDRLQPDTRTEAKAWIERRVPAGAFVLQEYHGPELVGPGVLQQLDEEVRTRLLERDSLRVYAVQHLPMLQVKPERSAAFYDLALYGDADVIVISDAVRSRYLAEPQRFGRQVAFYDALDRAFEKSVEFSSSGRAGPTISIYTNPDHVRPFSERDTLAGPRPVPPSPEHEKMISRSEGTFYSNLGLNYEYFGHTEAALAAYELALRYPIIKPHVYRSLVLGRTRCLLKLRRNAEAAEALRRGAEQTPSKEDRQRFLAMRQRILDALGGR